MTLNQFFFCLMLVTWGSFINAAVMAWANAPVSTVELRKRAMLLLLFTAFLSIGYLETRG